MSAFGSLTIYFQQLDQPGALPLQDHSHYAGYGLLLYACHGVKLHAAKNLLGPGSTCDSSPSITRRHPANTDAACRWFPSDHIQAPQAAWLDIILYSREQLVAERAALPRSGLVAELPDAPWGIISIKVR